MCCHYFLGHVDCQNLPWQSLINVYVLGKKVTQGAMTRCMEKKDIHLCVEKRDPEVVKTNYEGNIQSIL